MRLYGNHGVKLSFPCLMPPVFSRLPFQTRSRNAGRCRLFFRRCSLLCAPYSMRNIPLYFSHPPLQFYMYGCVHNISFRLSGFLPSFEPRNCFSQICCGCCFLETRRPQSTGSGSRWSARYSFSTLRQSRRIPL